MNPASWMLPECIPDGFEWKDPSKIQIGEIFHLLTHWKARQDQDLDPLIWSPTCPFMQDGNTIARRTRVARRIRALDPPGSDEETFVLPLSDDIDADDHQDHPENLGEFFQRHDASDGGQSASVASQDSDTDMHSPDSGSSGASSAILLYCIIAFSSRFIVR